MTTTLSPPPCQKKLELKQRSQAVPMDPETKQKFLRQLETQVAICAAGVERLEETPDMDFNEFQRVMRMHVYENDLDDKVPFKTLFNELYHVHKRFNSNKPLDKAERNSIYMTFYTYNFNSDVVKYERESQTLKIRTPTLDLDIVLTTPLPDEALIQSVRDEVKKTKYVNLGYHKDTEAVTLDIFY